MASLLVNRNETGMKINWNIPYYFDTQIAAIWAAGI